MRHYVNTYPNRTLCNVLDEMRACVKTANYSYLPGLIEEVQSLGNRMEAGLEDLRDIKDARAVIKELAKELEKLQKEKEALNEKN